MSPWWLMLAFVVGAWFGFALGAIVSRAREK